MAGPRNELAAVAANLPNHGYHKLHVDVLPTVSDQILQTITLSLVSVTAILVAALAFRLPVRPAAPVPSAAAAPGLT